MTVITMMRRFLRPWTSMPAQNQHGIPRFELQIFSQKGNKRQIEVYH